MPKLTKYVETERLGPKPPRWPLPGPIVALAVGVAAAIILVLMVNSGELVEFAASMLP